MVVPTSEQPKGHASMTFFSLWLVCMAQCWGTQASFKQTSLDIIQTNSTEQDLTMLMKCFGSTSVLFLGSMGHCTVWTSSAAYSSTSINERLISTCADCLITELGMNVKRIWEARYVLRKQALKKASQSYFPVICQKKDTTYYILFGEWVVQMVLSKWPGNTVRKIWTRIPVVEKNCQGAHRWLLENCSANPVLENYMHSLIDYDISIKLFKARKIIKINWANLILCVFRICLKIKQGNLEVLTSPSRDV